MDKLIMVLQVVIALGIVNVWLLRFSRATAYRGGNAKSLTEEFAVYGIPYALMLVVGFFKLFCAAGLLVGLYYPAITQPAALGMALLMTGAVAMHVKVGDPPMKALPATLMLMMSLAVAYYA